MTRKELRRLRIKTSVRGKISGTKQRPRLTVFRSNKQIYAQLIDDVEGRTLASASSLALEAAGAKKEIAAKVGELIAQRAKEAGVESVVFMVVSKSWQMPLAMVVLNFKEQWQQHSIE